jgi:shikimate 5-dehydrogenase
MPFRVDRLEEHAAVVDHVFSPTSTSLMAATRALGCVAIEGRDILLAQVRRQFQRMLGREMPLVPLTGLVGSDSFETAGVGLAHD